MKNAFVWIAISMAACGIVLIAGSGCEEAGGTGSLSVSPSKVEFRGTYSTEIFTASSSGALSLPLTWSVSDSSMGSIISSSGSNAVYRRAARTGTTVIIAKDQYNSEGYATITQR